MSRQVCGGNAFENHLGLEKNKGHKEIGILSVDLRKRELMGSLDPEDSEMEPAGNFLCNLSASNKSPGRFVPPKDLFSSENGSCSFQEAIIRTTPLSSRQKAKITQKVPKYQEPNRSLALIKKDLKSSRTPQSPDKNAQISKANLDESSGKPGSKHAKNEKIWSFLEIYLKSALNLETEAHWAQNKIKLESFFQDDACFLEEYIAESPGFTLRCFTVACFIKPKRSLFLHGQVQPLSHISAQINGRDQVSILMTVEKFSDKFQTNAYGFPSLSPFLEEMQEKTRTVCESLQEKGVFGYISVDFLTLESDGVGSNQTKTAVYPLGISTSYPDHLGVLQMVQDQDSPRPSDHKGKRLIFIPKLFTGGSFQKEKWFGNPFSDSSKGQALFSIERAMGAVFLPYKADSPNILGVLVKAPSTISIFPLVGKALKFIETNEAEKKGKGPPGIKNAKELLEFFNHLSEARWE